MMDYVINLLNGRLQFKKVELDLIKHKRYNIDEKMALSEQINQLEKAIQLIKRGEINEPIK